MVTLQETLGPKRLTTTAIYITLPKKSLQQRISEKKGLILHRPTFEAFNKLRITNKPLSSNINLYLLEYINIIING